MPIRSRATALALLALLLASGGCIFSPDDDETSDNPPPPPTLPVADTPDQLIENFRTTYGGMNFVAYRDHVLSPDYKFVLLPETVQDFGLPDNLYEYEDELAIAEHMFSGAANSDGYVLQAIEIQELEPTGSWLPVPDNDPYFGGFPDAKVCTFNLLFYFNTAGDLRYEVEGTQLFYVTTVDVDGTTVYRLLGQVDQTSMKRLPEAPALEI